MRDPPTPLFGSCVRRPSVAISVETSRPPTAPEAGVWRRLASSALWTGGPAPAQAAVPAHRGEVVEVFKNDLSLPRPTRKAALALADRVPGALSTPAAPRAETGGGSARAGPAYCVFVPPGKGGGAVSPLAAGRTRGLGSAAMAPWAAVAIGARVVGLA
ncbi:hypothetical protein DL769_011290 [Monosporascus sp. CRB-8-3]|nr:hypothetical protein DL769_011290 [Monosporascus sp. CRB-8-3]